MERLYLDPPSYHASQTRLADVRILLMRACQSLSYIKDECAAHGINLDVTGIDERRAANRPKGHPYNMIVIYLKDEVDFHNFEAFADPHRLNAGDKPRHLGSRLNLPESDHSKDGTEEENETSEDTTESSVALPVYNYEIRSDADKNEVKSRTSQASFGSSYIYIWDPEAEDQLATCMYFLVLKSTATTNKIYMDRNVVELRYRVSPDIVVIHVQYLCSYLLYLILAMSVHIVVMLLVLFTVKQTKFWA